MPDCAVLATEAKNGDMDAFSRLYSAVYRDMYRYAFYYLGNRPDAEDAVMQTVCEALASIAGLREEQAFKGWVFTILSRVCKRSIRAKSLAGSTVDWEELPDLAAPEDRALGEALELRQRLAALSFEERSIVLLSAVAGYNSAEIGAMLKKPAGTVRSRLSRALAKLRNQMPEDRP